MDTKTVNWYRLYSEGWGDDIVPDAYSHPAKYARGLIRQIYRYALERGFVQAGDHVVDPFGGVALGSLDAMLSGLHWTGCELEEKFVGLGNANLDLWRGRYAPHFAGWGTARLVQGDSRQLCRVIGDAAAVVSSPPYAYSVNQGGNGIDTSKFKGNDSTRDFGNGRSNVETDMHYGSTPGQLGSMREGNYSAVITSPPFGEGETRNRSTFQDGYVADMMSRAYTQDKQGTSAGNLATLKADDTGYAAAVSSPPYSESLQNHGASRAKNLQGSQNGLGDYPVTDGNLGHMSACVSSPPFEASLGSTDSDFIENRLLRGSRGNQKAGYGPYASDGQTYGSAPDNIGNDQGETFWSAAALIVGQVYQVLKPGGYTFWVTGDFVRNRKRVMFGEQWVALCESLGFVAVEHIVAWKSEYNGVQFGLFGEDKEHRKDRVSFFRRLANEKNPDNAILNEDVWIMQKPL